MLRTLLVLFAVALAPAQESAGDVVATFHHPDGKEAVVTRRELARDVGERHQRGESSAAAIKLLIDRRLVAREAAAAKLEPTREAIDARVRQIRDSLAEQELTLEAFLAQKWMSWQTFERDYVRLSLAHERLLMQSLGDEDPANVTPELLELWLREARARHRIVEDREQLPAGIIATVDGESIDLADLGEVLLANLADEERQKFVRRIVLRQLLQQEAERASIEVTTKDTLALIARRRARIEADPSYRGASYDEWLEATLGMTAEELARSPQLVATVQQERLMRVRHPDEQLVERLSTEREEVLRKHGEKRRLSIVLLRAAETPNELIPRSFDQAREELAALREKLDEQSFHRIAQIHSEDPYSKVRGGDLGEFARAAPELSDDLLAAAFALDMLEVSEPIRVPQGYALVKVTAIEPPPGDELLLERMREELGRALLEDLLEAAEVKLL